MQGCYNCKNRPRDGERCAFGGACITNGPNAPTPPFWEAAESAERVKPRICEVLGVEVGQPFKTESEGPIFLVNEKGEVVTKNRALQMLSVRLINIINNPETIIRLPHLTFKEKELCKLSGAKYITRDNVGYLQLWDNEPTYADGQYYSGGKTVEANVIATFYGEPGCFPSIHPGDCICVEEVN